MRSLRGTLLVLTAAVAFMPFLTSNATIVVATDQSLSDDASLTADTIGTQEALPIAELDKTQITEKMAYGYTEVDYAIRELMVASDVSFLGFDCAILSADYSNICGFFTESAAFRPSSALTGNLSLMTYDNRTGARRNDHNS